MSLDDAQVKMEAWRRDYNEVRPHSAIGNKAADRAHEWLSGIPAGMSSNPGIFQLRVAYAQDLLICLEL